MKAMENIGSVTEARTKYRNKMYVYRCVRQSGYVLEFGRVEFGTACTVPVHAVQTISKNAINARQSASAGWTLRVMSADTWIRYEKNYGQGQPVIANRFTVWHD